MAQEGNEWDFNKTPPPPGSYYNVNEQHLPAPTLRRRGRSWFCTLLKWLCGIAMIVVTLVGIGVLVFWLLVHPKDPRFYVESVQIDGLTSSSSPINTSITFEMKAENPNKHMIILYDIINVNVEANGASVGSGSIPPFYQGHENTAYVTGDLTAKNLTLSSDTARLLATNSSNLPLYVMVNVHARVKVDTVRSTEIKVKVNCDLIVDLTKISGSQLRSEDCKTKW